MYLSFYLILVSPTFSHSPSPSSQNVQHVRNEVAKKIFHHYLFLCLESGFPPFLKIFAVRGIYLLVLKFSFD